MKENTKISMDEFMKLAIQEAKDGYAEGGIPIGSVLVRDGELIAKEEIKECKKKIPFCMVKWIA